MKGMKKSMGLYDSRNGKTVFASYMVDVSDICPKSEQCILKYATITDGLICQINDMYKKGNDLGIMVHYNISNRSIGDLSLDEVFVIISSAMGVDPKVLAKAIFDNAPFTAFGETGVPDLP